MMPPPPPPPQRRMLNSACWPSLILRPAQKRERRPINVRGSSKDHNGFVSFYSYYRIVNYQIEGLIAYSNATVSQYSTAIPNESSHFLTVYRLMWLSVIVQFCHGLIVLALADNPCTFYALLFSHLMVGLLSFPQNMQHESRMPSPPLSTIFFETMQKCLQTLVNVQVSDANFSHVSSAAKVISSAAVDQKQIIAMMMMMMRRRRRRRTDK